MSNSPPDEEKNYNLVKKYKDTIEALKQALIIEANSRGQYNKMFLIDTTWEEKFGKKSKEDAFEAVSEEYIRSGKYHHMRMPPIKSDDFLPQSLPSVYDAGQDATKLQLQAIELNKELKEKLDKVSYNNVNKDGWDNLQSRFKVIKPIVLNLAGETMLVDLKPRLVDGTSSEPPDRYKYANQNAVMRGMAAALAPGSQVSQFQPISVAAPKGGSVKSKKRHRRKARHTRHKKRKTKTNRKKKHRKSRR